MLRRFGQIVGMHSRRTASTMKPDPQPALASEGGVHLGLRTREVRHATMHQFLHVDFDHSLGITDISGRGPHAIIAGTHPDRDVETFYGMAIFCARTDEADEAL